MNDMIKSDLSTLNLEKIQALPIYKGPRRLGDSMGSGCAGDAPGFPSYFLREHYAPNGNDSTMVIRLGGVSYQIPEFKWARDGLSNRDEILRALWIPLPIDHPRVVAWIRDTYAHHHSCYIDPRVTGAGYNPDQMIVFPVPSYKLKHPMTDPRFEDEINASLTREAELQNAGYLADCASVCAPENHSAVQIIRRFYPAHMPDLEQIARPTSGGGHWWQTLAEQPAPENCPGEYRWSRGTGNSTHPVNGSWCQVCGWKQETLTPQ